MEPQRIQLRRRKGWRMPEGTVKVDRTTRWGNPFIVGVHGTRAECLKYFRLLCRGVMNLGVDAVCVNDQRRFLARHPMLDFSELRGRDLACWCPLNKECHADFLIQVSNAPANRRSDRSVRVERPVGRG